MPKPTKGVPKPTKPTFPIDWVPLTHGYAIYDACGLLCTTDRREYAKMITDALVLAYEPEEELE